MVSKVGTCLTSMLAISMASNLNMTISVQDEISGQSIMSLSLIMKDELLNEGFEDFMVEMNKCKVESDTFNCPVFVWNSQGLVQEGWTPSPCSYYDPICLQQVSELSMKSNS